MPKNIGRRPGETCMVMQRKLMFLLTHILTLPEALSFLLSCYMGGVGWGNDVDFTCAHRMGYIVISSLALAQSCTHA